MLKSGLNFLLAECVLIRKECIWLQMTLHCCKRQNPSKMNYFYITVCSFWLALQFVTIVCTNLCLIFLVTIYSVKIAFQLPVILVFLSVSFLDNFFSKVCFSKLNVKNLEELSKIPVTKNKPMLSKGSKNINNKYSRLLTEHTY